GYSPGIHRGLPGRHLTFIISLGGPVDIAAMPDRRHLPVAFDAFVAGYHDGPATIAHDGNQCGIGLDLTSAGLGPCSDSRFRSWPGSSSISTTCSAAAPTGWSTGWPARRPGPTGSPYSTTCCWVSCPHGGLPRRA